MRQGQQNRRGRGRNNNQNRKTQNPLTRSFESTGPDVKVRGTPAHIAEKYMSLARDAQSSGDPVLAENYLQHAEHYNRIILTYREQQMSQGGEFNPNAPRPQSLNPQDGLDDDMNDDETSGLGAGHGDDGNVGGMSEQPNMPQQRSFEGGQRYDNRPRHNNHRHEGNRFDRGDRRDRGEQRFNRQDRSERHERHDRDASGEDEGFNGQSHGQRRREPYQGDRQNDRQQGDRQQSDRQGNRAATQGNFSGGQPPAMAAPAGDNDHSDQPAFLRRPVRRTRRSESAEAPEARQAVADEQE